MQFSSFQPRSQSWREYILKSSLYLNKATELGTQVPSESAGATEISGQAGPVAQDSPAAVSKAKMISFAEEKVV